MADIAIRADRLSKRYWAPRRQQRPSYRTLQEDLCALPRRAWSALTRPAAKRHHGRIEETERDFIWALKDVSFELSHGEVVGLIGRNGAGKSTLLRALSRITEPTSGRAEIHGRVGTLLEVGTGFHPELTGRENIALSGTILGMRRSQVAQRFDEIVDFAGVQRFVDVPVKRYSTGMYLRLAFAVAAHLDTEILLVDEVLAVGDAEFQKKCLGKMGDVTRQGRTILFVSHNMNAIEQLCQTVLYLEDGRTRELSTDVRSTVQAYLFGENEVDAAVAEWCNPEDEFCSQWFEPRSFSIRNEAGRIVRTPIRNDERVWIEVEADLPQYDPALQVGYAIYGEDGQLLYMSFHTDLASERWPRLAEGRCVLRTALPVSLLNEGCYRIELVAALYLRAWLLEPGVSAPAVLLTVRGGLSDSPYWMLKRPGVLAPVMTWETADAHS